MEYTLKTSNKGSNKKNGQKTVSVSQATVEHIIDLLSNVECTCVWSERDNEYLKVNDVPEDIVEELSMSLKMTKFAM